ncbi:MAG: hypothetical protein MUC95_00460 [Spirochaetes bacterium]|nr:hypothetical protein [Spirochaetota bacterium]
MRIKQVLSILFIFSVTALPLSAGEDGKGGWEVVSEKNGIKIENREMKGLKMKQLRAACEVDAPVEVIYEVMDGGDRYPEWFGGCIIQTQIKRISEFEKTCYHVVDVPWPLGDRDAVARVTTKADWKKGEVEYRVESIRPPEDSKWGMDQVTKDNGRVRMPVMDGIFSFSRTAPDRSKFTYVAIADPGIPLPGWILEMFSNAQPRKTLDNIRNQVKKNMYWKMASKRHNKAFTLNLGK